MSQTNTLEKFEVMVKLNPQAKEEFSDFIKDTRAALISPPKDTTKKAQLLHRAKIEKLLKNHTISEAITELRQLSYDQFLIEESKFNGVILSEIAKQFNTPRQVLQNITSQLYALRNVSEIEFQEKFRQMFGEFTMHISPYIYELCLSNTQSRRSRAGKVFEGIIYFLYEYYGFSYDSQASIGKKAFSDLGLGKVVDSILPSAKAFKSFRAKTIVGSMKTTLRERWQQVVEESARSNLPNIYLLTVDTKIPILKAKQMSEHNIIIVVLKNIKQQISLKNTRNIIDFETFFTKEIPDVMAYWGQNHD